MEEIWRSVKGYEGSYEVSNLGNVRSLVVWNGHKHIKREKPYLLKTSKTTTGYWKIELSKNKKKKSIKVHRLVAYTFIKKPKGKDNINHLDFNPLNNNVNNLEWVTQQENVDYSAKHQMLGKVNKTKAKAIIQDYQCGMKKEYIEKKYNITPTIFYGLLKKYKVPYNNVTKYNVDLNKLYGLIDENLSNKEIAKILNCTAHLVATRKCQYKKENKK